IDGVPTVCSTPRAVLAFPCGSRSMTRVRRPYIASATPRLTVEVVFPTPPFWLAMVTTRIRPGAGNCSWSAACSTRVARIASMAIGLSKSAPTAWSAARLVRSRSPGSVIGAPSSPPCSTWNGVCVPRGTADGPFAPHHSHARGGTLQGAGSPCSPGHDHHGSGCRTEFDTDGPGVYVPHPGRFQLRDERGYLGRRAGAHERDQLGPGREQAPAPADEPGERRHGPGGDDVDRPDRPDDGALLRPAADDLPG